MKYLKYPSNPRVLALTVAAMLAWLHLSAFAGSAVRFYYDNLSSSSSLTSFRIGLASLTNAPIFPDNPTFREQIDDFSSLPGIPLRAGLQGKDNSGSDYGSYIIGFLEAPETGNYRFNIASDDNSALFLSTDHLREHRKLIAFELESGAPLFGGARQDQRFSVPIALVRGQKYYFEVLHKQAAGGSYIQVGWERPDGAQEIIPALHLAQYPLDLFTGTGDTNQPPTFNSRGFNGGNITNKLTLAEGADLLLQLDVIAAQPTTFRWTRNGVDIPGENLSFLRVARVSSSWDGSEIQAHISNAYGEVNSETTVLSVTPDTASPVVQNVETGGNPNLLRITYSEPITPDSALNLANYEIRRSGEVSPLVIQKAVLLPGDQTVELSGVFNFRTEDVLQITLQNVQDQAAVPNNIQPNPSIVPFRFGAPTGTTYSFENGRPSGFRFFGIADVTNALNFPNGSYLRLTDNDRNLSGAVLLTERRDVDQVRIRFKTFVALGGTTVPNEAPGDGFSVNIAADLPLGTLGSPEEGFTPDVPGNRISFTFDSHLDSSQDLPSFGVILNNQQIADVIAGTNGVPPITNPDGRWVEVDIDLRRNGQLTLKYDGVTLLDKFPTAFEVINNAQISFAARTRRWYQTHWIDDLNINYGEGDVGNAGVAGESVLSGNFPEGSEVKLVALPIGAGPFRYQWLKNNQPIVGETGRFLRFPATIGAGGNFSLIVSNTFSTFTSAPGSVVIVPDTRAPELVSARAVAGGVNRVYLQFNELLDPVTATDPTLYTSAFFAVKSASLSSDGRGVVLETTPLRVGINYPLTIAGLRDRSTAANAAATELTFTSSLTYADEILADNPTRFFRFNETSGTVAFTEVTSGDRTGTNGTYLNLPKLGVPSLVPSTPGDYAVLLDAAVTNYVTVPNGGDINDFRGPWPKKSFEFWFNARSVPTPGLTGIAATAGLYEEGGNLRSIHFHLWRDPKKQNPGEAELVMHAFNDTSDGPGSPFGLRNFPAVYITHTIRTNQTYHVVGVFDGRTDSLKGEIRLYVDGQIVGRKGGVGQIYNHNGDIRIGSGNARTFFDVNAAFGSFDGVIDDLSLYNVALSEDRIRDHYRAGIGASLSSDAPPTTVVGVNPKGNPNQLTVIFNQPVSAESANRLANYLLKGPGGNVIPIQSALLQKDLVSVRLSGSFSFQSGAAYQVGVQDVADILVPSNVVAATNLTFTFVSAGPVSIDPAGSNLGAKTVVENAAAEFNVVARGEPPFRYQWAFNGQPIPGANADVLRLAAPLSAAGSYTVKIENDFSSILSTPALLTVTPDVSAASLVNVRGLAGSLNEVRLLFNEPVDLTTGSAVSTYSIPGLVINSSSVSANGLEVKLRTSALTDGKAYTLTVSGLRDRAAAGNSLTTTASFTAGVYYRDEVLAENAVRYWTFDETSGTNIFTLVSRFDVARENLVAVLRNEPTLGVPGLIPNLADVPAIGFTSSRSNLIQVPNARDLNVILGPWIKRSHVFSFKATNLPRITDGTNVASPALFAHGRLAFYLYGTQDTNNPTEALLVFHAHNNASEGPGSPWGALTGNPATAKFVATPIVAGQTYHVVGVLDGDPNGFAGQLRLYVNGQSVGSIGGIGQLYKHANNPPTFGQGAFLRHDGVSQTLDNSAFFDGVIDEFAVLPVALSPSRVAQLYQFAQTPPPSGGVVAPVISISLLGGNAVLRWEGGGQLQRAPQPDGPFNPIAGAASPYTTPLPGTAAFYRVVVP